MMQHLRVLALLALLSLLGLGLTACGTKKEVVHQSPVVEAAQSLERRAESAYRKGDARGAQESLKTAANVYQSLAMNDAYVQTQISLARIELDAAGNDAAQLDAARKRLLAAQNLAGLSQTNQRLIFARLAASWIKVSVRVSDFEAAKPLLDRAMALCVPTCAERNALDAMQLQWLLGTGATSQAQMLADQLVMRSTTPETTQPHVSLDKTERAKFELANALRLRAQVSLTLNKAGAAEQDAQNALVLDQEMGASPRVIADLELLAAAQEALSQTVEAAQTREQLARARTALMQLSR